MKNKTLPSLEKLIETGYVELDVLHPGGLEITRELAELCHIGKGSKVLDVASGTGESALYLAKTFGCEVTGVDISDYMVRRSLDKAEGKQLPLTFVKSDAHNLPFASDTFNAVISECTVCLLEKEKVIREMARVTKPGGRVGIHDVCWQRFTPESLKRRLAQKEGERPETLEGWKGFFQKAGMQDVITVDKPFLTSEWVNDIRHQLGPTGMLKIFYAAFKEWGISGLRDIAESERIFRSKDIGYGIIVGRKD